ncbi:hypothetical protein LEP1GSC067_3706 [Leptospira interrogans serovar Lora str. TE 1992]|uniref:Uncharacterized protein n=1 Tax=Leptospira interrogans serovar Lora str. TE 1992 TaxID=1193028 RepID=M3F1D6_LEPIR|nr:hypothetical protein LEP1GSC067_3706 [Leptospira interrogans serovar Lora str. TE 1992]EMN09079.1 hypothetical protein LEP1GSC053_4195 [Leptospira interrogans serovar Muenchen str. Brem 129]KWV25835.1 hypothetical protein LA733_1011 [Leptospira interrogans]KWV27762.1 hypothetical protein LA702_1523 [Leptospira interrogans]
MKIVGTMKYQKNHRPSDFFTKPLFCGHYQNLNSILASSSEKKISKSMSSYNFFSYAEFHRIEVK